MYSSSKGHGASLAVQWLGLGAFTAEGPGSIPGWGAKIPQAVQRGQFKKKKNSKGQSSFLFFLIFVLPLLITLCYLLTL